MSGPALFNDPRGLPCISLWRPWAQWVRFGWKTIETRTHDRFRCLERRRIGIHAAMKWDKDAGRAAALWLPNGWDGEIYRRMNHGQIICTALVQRVAMLRDEDSRAAMIDCGTIERFGLFLTDIRIVPDVGSAHVKGGQGIFYVRGLSDSVEGGAL